MSVKFDNIIPLNELTEGHLEFLDDNGHLLADVPFFPVLDSDKTKLVGKDYDNVTKSILPKNIKKEFAEYLRAKNSTSNITELASKLKESANSLNRLNNRYTFMKDKFIKGVGIDGMGGSAKVPRVEEDFIEDVRYQARMRGARCVDLPDDEDARLALRNSISSMLSWRNINLGGIPFGSPIQVSIFITTLLQSKNTPKKLQTFIDENSKLDFLKYIFGFNHQGELTETDFQTITKRSLATSFRLIEHKNTIKNSSMTEEIKLDEIPKTDHELDKYSETKNSIKLVFAIYIIFYRYLCIVRSFYDKLKSQLKTTMNKNGIDKLEKSVSTSLEEFNKYVKLCLINHFGIYGQKSLDNFITAEPKFKLNDDITFTIEDSVNISYIDKCSRDEYILSYDGETLNIPETMERFTKFLTLPEDKVVEDPDTRKLIAVGAPVQNDTIYRCTLREADSYYRALSDSRKVYVKYFKKKIDVMKSGIPAGKLMEYKDLVEAYLNNIQESAQLSKEIKCQEMKLSLSERYRLLRRKEYEYGSQEAVLRLRGKTSLKNKNKNVSSVEQDTINLERVGVALEAESLRRVTELSYKLFLKYLQAYGKTIRLCPDLLEQIMELYKKIDDEIQAKIQQDLQVKRQEIEAKYGTLLKNQRVFGNVQVKPTEAPPEYTQYISSFFSGQGPAGIQAAITAPTLFDQRKKYVPTQLVYQINTRIFWDRIRTALNNKTIYVVVGGSPSFSDSSVQFFDVVNSMLSGKPILIPSQFATSEGFRRIISRKGYLLMAVTPNSLKNPNEWRYLSRDKLQRLFAAKATIRFNMFNLITNNQFFNNLTNSVLPPSMKLSQAVQTKCQKTIGTQYEKCPFIISRMQLGAGLQKASQRVPGLEGFDFASGSSLAERNPNREQAETNIFRKGI